jgi:hypothetical protein
MLVKARAITKQSTKEMKYDEIPFSIISDFKFLS